MIAILLLITQEIFSDNLSSSLFSSSFEDVALDSRLLLFSLSGISLLLLMVLSPAGSIVLPSRQNGYGLKREYETYKSLFEDSPSALILLSRSGRIIKTNHSLKKLVPRGLVMVLIKEVKNQLKGSDDEYFHRGMADFFFERKRIVYKWSVSRVTYGQNRNLVVDVSDISEQVELENQLMQYKHFFTLSKGLLCVINLQGYFIEVNNEALELLGYTEEELVGHSFLQFVHDDDLNATDIEIKKLKSGVGSISYTNRFRAKDGTYKYLLWGAAADSNNGLLYCTAKDITGMTEAEKQVKKSEEKYKTLVDTAPFVLYEYDLESGGIYYSDHAQKVIGYSPAELTSYPKLWFERIIPEDRNVILGAIKRFTKRHPFTIEYRIRDSEGEIKWIRDMSVNHESGVNLLRGVAIDITKEKELSEELITHIDLLAKKEKQLTLAIHTAREGIIDWDLERNTWNFNGIIQDILELRVDPSVHISQYWKELKPRVDYGTVFKTLQEMISGEMEHAEREVKIKRRNGNDKWLKCNAVAVKSPEDDSVKRIICVVMDITERKSLLLESENHNLQLNLLIGSIPGVVFSRLNDDKNTILFLSDFVEVLTGFTSQDIMNGSRDFKGLINKSDLKKIRKALVCSHREQKQYSVTYRINTIFGERWVTETGEFRSYKDAFDKGRLDGVIIDVTDKIKAEERMVSAVIDAEDRERSRIAKELHDGVQQTLVSSLFTFESLREHFSQHHEFYERFSTGVQLLMDGINDSRAIAHTLMPKQLQEFGLVDSVQKLIDSLNTAEMEVHFIHNVESEMSEKVQVNLYRITQEALNNIVKHAHATEVFIQLFEGDFTFQFTIEDDGKGFSYEALREAKSLGMDSIKSRCKSFGASLDIDSSPNQGTFIRIEWEKELVSTMLTG